MKIFSILIITAMLSATPTLLIAGQNVYASTSAAEMISQSQVARQLGVCISDENTLVSCNNWNDQDQRNFGSGNERVSQSQESRQEALCSSGGNTFFSCNNENVQDQRNFGGSAAAQSNSGDSWRNSYSGVSQSQSSDQRSLCVNNGDTAGSCNNFSEQSQFNYGSGAFSQFR